jgi:bacterioferritin (cytochrome b1)
LGHYKLGEYEDKESLDEMKHADKLPPNLQDLDS